MMQPRWNPFGTKTTANTKRGKQAAQVMMTEKYTYSPLDERLRHIRLLSLPKSSDPAANLHCSLRTASLDDDPVYIAISYTWGEAGVGHDIVVDGKVLSVGDNLN